MDGTVSADAILSVLQSLLGDPQEERTRSTSMVSRMPRAGIRPYPAFAEQRFGIADTNRLLNLLPITSPHVIKNFGISPTGDQTETDVM